MATIHINTLNTLFQSHIQRSIEAGVPDSFTLYEPRAIRNIFHNTRNTLISLKNTNKPVNHASTNELMANLLKLTDSDILLLSARYALDSVTHQFIIRANNSHSTFVDILQPRDTPPQHVTVQRIVPRAVTDITDWVTQTNGQLLYERTYDIADVTEQELVQLEPHLTDKLSALTWHVQPANQKQKQHTPIDIATMERTLMYNVNDKHQLTPAIIHDITQNMERDMVSVLISPRVSGDYKNITSQHIKQKINRIKNVDVVTQLHQLQAPHPRDLEKIQNVIRFQSRCFDNVSDDLALVERCTIMSMFDICTIRNQNHTLTINNEQTPLNNPEDVTNLINADYYMKAKHVISNQLTR